MTDALETVPDAVVADLLRGAVDLHCHSGPSVMPRLVDHIEAVEEAGRAGMRAVLFKDHYYPTAAICELIRDRLAHTGVEPLAGIVLNNAIGGFNVYALESALKLGTSIVWMPTVSAANHIRKGFSKTLLAAKSPMRRPLALTVIDERGRILDSVKEVLDIIAEYDVTMSGGHLHISEVFALFDEAKARGCRRLLLNHPTYTLEGTVKDMKALAGMGVMIEHSGCMFIESRFREFSPDDLRSYIDAVGADMTFFGSDLGQTGNPSPVEGMRAVIRLLAAMGYSHDDIRKMTSGNARRLIGLGANAKERDEVLARSA